MNPLIQRGLLLFQQGKNDLAVKELRQSIAEEPGDAFAHALLSLALARLEEFKPATEAARTAIGLAPDMPFAHYALAAVLQDRGELKAAGESITEAIRLDPEDADYHALQSGIRFNLHDWQGALEAAETGLQLDAEHVGCANLRAMALVKLNRKNEAGASIDTALARSPENSATHANKGWLLLEQGKPEQALEHFREALRLDPTCDWARQGIVEALKARYKIYSWMLRYFLWMSKLSGRAQWSIILGGYFGQRILRNAANENPSLAPFIWPVIILYAGFVILTWTADPLFNLALRLNRFGRLALSEEEITASNCVGACLLGGLLGLGAFLVFGHAILLLAGLMSFLLVIPTAATFGCQSGWPRTTMGAYTGLLALFAISGVVMTLVNGDPKGPGALLVALCVIGSMLSSWVANALRFARVKR